MEKPKKWPILLIVGVIILMLGLIGSIALAQDAAPEDETPAQEQTMPKFDGPWGFRGLGTWGGPERHAGGSDMQTYLAEALGITVDQLADAQQRAYEAAMADAVAAGELTQEQADQMLAAQALNRAVDRQAILATALGMTTEELEAAFAEGQTIRDLMDKKGLDAETFMANAGAAYEAAVQQAVTDGVITQAQADEILSGDKFNLFDHGDRGGHHGGGRGGHGFGLPRIPDSTTPDTTTPETSDTNSDA